MIKSIIYDILYEYNEKIIKICKQLDINQIFDKNIYTNNRCFRMINQSKKNIKAILKPYNNNDEIKDMLQYNIVNKKAKIVDIYNKKEYNILKFVTDDKKYVKNITQ